MNRFSLLGWDVDAECLTVTRGGETVKLNNKTMQLLVYLAERQGRLVSYEELEADIWDGNSFIAKRAATNTVWQLRKAMQGSLSQEEFIETIPKRGYRLNAPVEPIADKRHPSWRTKAILLAGAEIIALAVIAWLLLRDDPSPVSLEREIITDYPGTETEAALTHTGDRIAFIWSQLNKSPNLYWKHVGDRNDTPHQLTNSTDTEATPSWSPDGKTVAFLRVNGETRACSVHTVSVITGVERKLTTCQATKPGTLAWSPNGKWIAYAYHDGEHHGLAVIDPVTEEMRKVTRSPKPDMVDADLAWSPDSELLAYISRVTVEEDRVFITDLEGDTRHLEKAPGDIVGMAWSRHDDELIVAAIPEGEHRRQLLRLDIDDGRVLGKFDQGALEAYSPGLSGDGNLMVYDASNIVVGLGTTFSGQNKIDELTTVASLSADREPTISANGQRLAFTSTRSGAKEIWYHQIGDNVPTQITSFGVTNVFGPTWHPNGKLLMFLAPDANGRLQVFLFEVDSHKLRQLTREETDHMPPSWSADGGHIYTSFAKDDAWTIHRYAFQGVEEGAADPEVVSVGYFSQEAPDGSLFIFRLTDSTLHKRTAEGEEQVFQKGFERRDWGNWVPGNDGIYAVMRTEAQDLLTFTAYDGGESQTIAELPAKIIRSQNSLALDPANNRLVVAYYTMQQADIFGLRRP